MPSAKDVHHSKWSNERVLFDNGWYSVIAGDYEHDGLSEPRLCERWNGHEDAPLGFPNSRGRSTWHNVPEFLEVPILHGLLDELARNPSEEVQTRVPDILRELERAVKLQNLEQ